MVVVIANVAVFVFLAVAGVVVVIFVVFAFIVEIFGGVELFPIVAVRLSDCFCRGAGGGKTTVAAVLDNNAVVAVVVAAAADAVVVGVGNVVAARSSCKLAFVLNAAPVMKQKKTTINR